MKKFLTIAAIAITSLALTACDNNGGTTNGEGSDFGAGIVTDISGVNDQSFNQSAWTGLQRLHDSTGARINYLESDTDADIGPNLDRLLDEDKDILWAISFMAADAIASEAMTHPDQMYGIIDFNFGDDILDNVVAVMFRDNENSFLAGYMAAKHSETGNIGFIGGGEIPIIEGFEAGFEAGAHYAAAKHGFDIEVQVQYIGNFFDATAARSIALVMFTGGADVAFAAAGGAGQGLIDAAIEMDRYVIGVDMDQRHLAPNHMIASTLKLVGDVMYDICMRMIAGENVGGQNVDVGIAEGGVGITPFDSSTAQLVDRAVFDSTMEVSEQIAEGSINVPSNRVELQAFLAGL